MRVHLRGDEADGIHTRFTVFMNGANCGQLCMEKREANFFRDVFMQTKYKIPEDNMYSTGIWSKKEDETA